MLQCFAACIKGIMDTRPRVPLAYATERDLRRYDAIDDIAQWFTFLDRWARDIDRATAERAHREHLAERERRLLMARSRAAEDARGEDLAPRRGHERMRVAYAEPGVVGPSFVDLGLGRCVVRDAETGLPKRIAKVDFTTGKEVPWNASPEYFPATPRHAQSFPNAGEVPLPETDWVDDAGEAIADPAGYAELKSKEVIAESEWAATYAPDETCPTCRRGPALCTCPIEEQEEEDEYDGFTSDTCDRYIRMQGELARMIGRRDDLIAGIPAARKQLRATEQVRGVPGTKHDQDRLRRIAKMAAAIDQARRELWVLGKQIEELEAKLALLEELDEPREADFEDLEFRNLAPMHYAEAA